MTNQDFRDEIAAGLFVSVYSDKCKLGMATDPKVAAKEYLEMADRFVEARWEHDAQKAEGLTPDDFVGKPPGR